MIASLRGIACAPDDDGVLVIEAGDVGYRVVLSARDKASDMLSPNATVFVFIRSITTEMQGTILYGFLDAADRRAFDRIIKLEGVGPSKAMAVLSMVSAAKLAALIAVGDVAVLTKVPGIGPKVAAKIMGLRL